MTLASLLELTAIQPIVPYIREGDMAVRHPWRSPERRLLDYCLIYVQEGKCCFIVDHHPYYLLPGEFCLIQPGSLVDLEGLTNTATPYLHFDMFYQADREDSFPTKPGQIDLTPYAALLQPRLNDFSGIQVPVKLTPSKPAIFLNTFLNLVELWPLRDTLSQLTVQQLGTELIVAILTDHYQSHGGELRRGLQLHWIPSFLSLHLQEQHSIETLAKRAHMSPSWFRTVFKKEYGLSPHQYLLDMRLKHAQELLQRTGFTQEETAGYCGFSDIHHFSKTFKKKTGMSPGEWRALHRTALF